MPRKGDMTVTPERVAGAQNVGDAPPASAAPASVASRPMPTPGERWYVVHTQPHREARAESHLAGQGFRTFLPRFSKTVRHARQLRTVSAPLFPRYLFVGLDLERDRWRSINGTFGVTSLLMGDELPLAVPLGVVESLAASCRVDGHVALGNELVVGEDVRILSGPFSDLVGRLVRIDGPARVRVLLQLLNGEIAVSIAKSSLIRAP
jgi:transcription elongation factor/antiterminator RfaH